MSLKLSVLLSVVVASLGASTYNYNRCDIVDAGDGFGPLFWGLVAQSGNQCGTILAPQSEGTPVNLCNAVAFTGGAPTAAVSGYDTLRTMNASNTGSSLYWYVNDNAPTMSIGNLAYTVGRTTNTTTQTWVLNQIHPHWGRDNLVNEGSEHYVQGVAYPMEVHLVHFNSKYGTIGAAVASGNKDALLVVGVMMTIGSTDLPIMTALANQISTLTQAKTPLSSQVRVSDFYDGTGSYYSYRGGLTTPGCNEIVTWVVMKGTKTMTLTTLNKFKAATINPAAASRKFNTLATASTYGVYGNYRPLQPIAGRTIYSSDGATAACASFTEAQATCTSGVLFSGPSVVIQLVALALAILASRE
jgi:carbonic anhydrase